MISQQRDIFYYDVQYCYERALDVSECVDYLIEIRRKQMNEFVKGALCLGLVVILFLLADYFQINSFKDLF